MGWELRGNKAYYYRKVRMSNGRIRSVYCGNIFDGGVADVEDRKQREQKAAVRQCIRQMQQEGQVLDYAVNQNRREIRKMTAQILRWYGFYEHRGCWRYRMNNQLSGTSPDVPAIVTEPLLITTKTLQQECINSMSRDESSCALIKKDIDQTRARLLQAHPSILEELLIEHLLVVKLRLERAETIYQNFLNNPNITEEQIDFALNLVAKSQEQFQRSAESLARISKTLSGMPSAVQINIAGPCSQQANTIPPNGNY